MTRFILPYMFFAYAFIGTIVAVTRDIWVNHDDMDMGNAHSVFKRNIRYHANAPVYHDPRYNTIQPYHYRPATHNTLPYYYNPNTNHTLTYVYNPSTKTTHPYSYNPTTNATTPYIHNPTPNGTGPYVYDPATNATYSAPPAYSSVMFGNYTIYNATGQIFI
ncbi:unnamed protein product [Orchesella dallaii]|uniref:Uncharacterized protein n=1 Tax=Orchesella dallaii TaxID=48710 RepID=A0ABP1RGT0_9HEXA